MAEPQPIEPDEAPSPPAQPPARADWLVGADEGIEAELKRTASSESEARPAPRLFRPGLDASMELESPAAAAAMPPPTLIRPAAPPASPPPPRQVFGAVQQEQEQGDLKPGLTPMLSWEAGANSVPSLPRERAPIASVMPETQRDFPMDDAEERQRQKEERRADIEAAAESLRRSHTVVQPQAFEIEAPSVPWWVQVAHVLRHDRRIQALVAVSVLAVAVFFAWPRDGGFASVAELKRDAARYDGRSVVVKGKVGEVFPVGGGHAFNLHQGQDTLVVFTRVRTPRSREQVTVSGTISTGFLDGEARLALFESTEPLAK